MSIAVGIVLVIIIILCCPIRYKVDLDKSGATFLIHVFLFLSWSRKIAFIREEDGVLSKDLIDNKSDSIMEGKRIEENIEDENDFYDKNEIPATIKTEKKEANKPSIWEQIQFAWKCRFIHRSLQDIKNILIHSKPGYLNINGQFGTGDPMLTGIVEGVVKSVIPKSTENVEYCYIEKIIALNIVFKGCILPCVIIWILFKWFISKETRMFFKFREGKFYE